MTNRDALSGKPYLENQHVWFDERNGAPASTAEASLRRVHSRSQSERRTRGRAISRCSSLLCKAKAIFSAMMTATLFSALTTCASPYLKDNWPGTPVYLMTPLHRGYATVGPKNVQPDESHANGKGLFIDEYVAAVKEAGNIWAVNVIDLNAESGLFPMLKSHARFFHNEKRDMLHPNNAGHEQIARAIMRRIGCAPLLTNH